jgi:hypothetical protein
MVDVREMWQTEKLTEMRKMTRKMIPLWRKSDCERDSTNFYWKGLHGKYKKKMQTGSRSKDQILNDSQKEIRTSVPNL